LLEQLGPLAIEVIQSLCNAQSKILELEKVEGVMEQKAPVAGKLVNPISGVLRIPGIAGHVDRALLQIKSFNGKENLEKAGVDIPDLYEEREKMWGSHFVATGSPESNTNNLSEPTQRGEGFDAALYRAAGLESAPTETSPKPKGFDEGLRKGAGLPAE
jgi:hypothetical protein